ncbi:MAG: 50S ribosomal protein L7/L12 [Candidatus Coatesbacteria bacterium]|nr:MAG: 50S ribosomal protein L7/L12 [Candidatus Coatesbacteria bacterium]
MAKMTTDELIDVIKEMTVLELSDFVKAVEDEFGVTAAAPVAPVAAVGAPAGGETAAEEKSEFNVVLKDVGDQKVKVIKAVREVTSLGLKEAKELVEGAPVTVAEGLSKADADAAKAKIEEQGATIAVE